MADQIRVSLTPDTVQMQPNSDPVELSVVITNAGGAVDQYAVELDQLPTTWYSLSNTSVALFPQDKEEAKLVLHPPKGGSVKAGVYPFTVTVLSRADPTITTRVEGKLQIGAITSFELAMSPTKQTGRRGRYVLSLRNGGNADIDVALEATDPEDVLRFGFQPSTPHVAAGQKQSVKLTVKPRRSSIAGSKKSFDFKVKAAPNLGDAKAVQGQLVHKPRFRTWAPVRRLVVLVIIIAALSIAYVAVGQTSGIKAKVTSSALCTRLKFGCFATAVPGTTVGPLPTAVKGCHWVGAFGNFHKYQPSVVGTCLENEIYSPAARVSTQLTSAGLLLFDQKDGSTFLIGPSFAAYQFINGVTQQVHVPSAATKGTYGFIGAFADFHSREPSTVGDATESEQVIQATHVASQMTTNGLLIYTPAANHSFLVTANQGTFSVFKYDDGKIREVR